MAGYPPYYYPPGGAPPPPPAYSAYATPYQYGGASPPPSRPPSYYPYGGAPSAPPSAPLAGYGGVSYLYASSVPPPRPYDHLFPPGTDRDIIEIFHLADADGSGQIDDRELQMALSEHRSFSMRTVHLLMSLFTGNRSFKIGPKEFVSLYYSLQNWRANFERFDRDRSGYIDSSELQEALRSLGFSVSPAILDVLVSKFVPSEHQFKALDYDSFIDCCLIIKGLTEKFKEHDTRSSGTATFSYESFMSAVLPFLVV